jgi:hypothetical protein
VTGTRWILIESLSDAAPFVSTALRGAAFGGTDLRHVAETKRSRADDPILALPGEIKPLRIVLFSFLLLSAVSALFLEDALAGAVERGALSAIWLFLPLILYGVFFSIYGVDRWFLVKRRSFPPGRAFFQVAFGIVFGVLLLPSTIGDWRDRPAGMMRLLSHPDAEVRMVAVEAVGFRGQTGESVAMLAKSLDDGDPRVAAAARSVLARWSGKDPSDVPGIRAWASRSSTTSGGR